MMDFTTGQNIDQTDQGGQNVEIKQDWVHQM